MELPISVRTERQVKEFKKAFEEKGQRYQLIAQVRHDDECHNGHNSFAITADLYGVKANGTYRKATNYGDGDMIACGSLHKEVAQHIPELAPFIKWHLSSTDGPMHYLANTLYHAGDKDCRGRRKDEPYNFQDIVVFGDNPIHQLTKRPKFATWLRSLHVVHGGLGFEDLRVVHIEHRKEPGGYDFEPKYTVQNYAGNQYGKKWHECPFDTRDEAIRFLMALRKCAPRFLKRPTAWGEGKEPDLEAARGSAVWPDATLEQLQDKDALTARLPALMADFKATVESLGMVY